MSLWIPGTWGDLPGGRKHFQIPSSIPDSKLHLCLELLKLQILPPSWMRSSCPMSPPYHLGPFLTFISLKFSLCPPCSTILSHCPGSQQVWRSVSNCTLGRLPLSAISNPNVQRLGTYSYNWIYCTKGMGWAIKIRWHFC